MKDNHESLTLRTILINCEKKRNVNEYFRKNKERKRIFKKMTKTKIYLMV